MPPPPVHYQDGPSIWQKSELPFIIANVCSLSQNHSEVRIIVRASFKGVNIYTYRMGALMGGGVGLTIGFIFGSWSIIRLALIFFKIFVLFFAHWYPFS